jgi:hypothetical protein
MAENAIVPQRVVTVSGAARLSLAAAATFMVLLAVLHVIKPELDPSWHPISEYANGRYGWVMMLSFFFLALSCAALVVAVRSQIGTIGGKIGLGALLIVAASLIAAGVFTTDPITASRDEMTTHGHLHALAAIVSIPGFPIAALLISLSLARRKQALSAVRRSLIWSALLTCFSVAAMFVYLVVALPNHGGEFGPGMLIGWLQRFVVVTYCFWLMTVAWHATRS